MDQSTSGILIDFSINFLEKLIPYTVKQRCGSASADPDLTYHRDADPDPDFYLMRIRLVTLMRIRIQVPKMMQIRMRIRMRIRIHYTERGHCIIHRKGSTNFWPVY